MDQPLSFLIDAPQTLSKDGEVTRSRVQVAKTGVFNDPRYGEFKITRSDFAKWVKNFKAFSISDGRLGVPADIDHSPEKRGDTEAVGWVKKLDNEGPDGRTHTPDQLWATVEWNTLGQQLIAEKRYAYISPSYTENYKDERGRTHGEALIGIALTNRPFLQMATVNLSQFAFAKSQHVPKGSDNDGDDEGLNSEDVTDLDDMPEDLDDLDLDKVDTSAHPFDDLMLDISDTARQKHATVVKKIDGQTKHMFPIPPGDKVHARAALSLLPKAIAAGHITSQEAAAIRAKAHSTLGTKNPGAASATLSQEPYSPSQMELDSVLTALNLSRETLGVAADADEVTVLHAIRDHKAKAAEPTPAEGVVTLDKDEASKLLADAAAGRAAAEELRVSKFESAFVGAQKEGKVTLGQKETMRQLYDINAESTLKLLDELQPSINMEPHGSGADAPNLDESSRALAKDFTDEVTPYAIDNDSLRLHSAAVAIEQSKGISYEKALEMAEAGVTA